MSTKKNQNIASLIATVVIAGLACAAAIVAAVMILGGNKGGDGGQPQQQASTHDTSYLTQEYRDEAGLAAHDLLDDSHEILRLFVTEGLHHNDEPYGNLPEDGYYTVNNTDYDLQKIQDLVHSVYVDDAAEKILTDVDGNGLTVYANRKIQQKVETTAVSENSTAEADSTVKYETVEVLGISSDFLADPSKSWVSCSIKIDYVEEGRCTLEVGVFDQKLDTLIGTAEADSPKEPDASYTVDMVKTNDGWRLEEFVTR